VRLELKKPLLARLGRVRRRRALRVRFVVVVVVASPFVEAAHEAAAQRRLALAARLLVLGHRGLLRARQLGLGRWKVCKDRRRVLLKPLLRFPPTRPSQSSRFSSSGTAAELSTSPRSLVWLMRPNVNLCGFARSPSALRRACVFTFCLAVSLSGAVASSPISVSLMSLGVSQKKASTSRAPCRAGSPGRATA